MLFLIGACGATSTTPDLSDVGTKTDLSGVADLAVSADLAGCPQSLASWCAHPEASWGQCVATLKQAEQPSSWPGWCAGAAGLSEQTCGSYVNVVQTNADVSTNYIYDSATGQLVAVYELSFQRSFSCVGGPASFALPSCSPKYTQLCPSAAGDAGAGN